MTTPPNIVDELTPEQSAAYSAARQDLFAAVDAAEDFLMKHGFSQIHATSSAAHLMMAAAARNACLTANMDGREPNREWFTSNFLSMFDKWVAAQGYATTQEGG